MPAEIVKFEAIQAWFKTFLTDLTVANEKVFSEVKFGKKATPTAFPSCIVLPGTIPEKIASTTQNRVYFPFTVVAITRSADTEGYLVSMRKLGQVTDALVTDRTQSGLVAGTEITQFSPDVSKPLAQDRHDSSVIVTFWDVL